MSEEEEPGAAALEDPEEQPTSIPAAIAAEQRSAMPLCKCFFIKCFFIVSILPFQKVCFN